MYRFFKPRSGATSRLCQSACGVCVSMLVGAPVSAEVTEIAGRNVQHITRAESTDTGEDRAMTAIEAVGVTIHDDGTVSSNRMWSQLDRFDESGLDRGYFERTWPDGSTTIERFESHHTVGEDGAETFEGTFDYVFGTGRFEGIEGEGSFHGTAHADGMLVVDWQALMDVADGR